MKKTKRVVSFAALVLACVMLFAATASAHSTSQSGIISWGDSCGWKIMEAFHINATSFNYKITTGGNMTQSRIDATLAGAAMWSPTVTITRTTGSSIGTVKVASVSDVPPNSNTIAWVALKYNPADPGNNRHITSWTIYMNDSKTITAKIMAHEFGHVIGLNDLEEEISRNKIMFYTDGTTAPGPTDYDRKGASVITGQHTSHSWTYRYFDTVNGHKRHRSACSGCWGWEYGSLVTNCTYSNAYCIYCGTHV